MKRRAYKQQCKRIEAIRDRWKEPLGLGAWSITICYLKTKSEYARVTGHGGSKTSASMATCFCDWRYLTAWIGINTCLWAHVNDWHAEQALVHELCHLLTDSLARAPKADREAHLESTCTALANAFVWTRKAAKG